MILTVVTLFDLAALLLGIAVILGWRPGPRSWWADRHEEVADHEEFHAATLGHGRRESEVQPKTVATSGTHFIKGRLRTIDNVAADNDPKEQILLSNMRGNDWPIVCETANGYRHTGVFEEKDRLVGSAGEVVEAGDDPRHVEYRKRKIAEHRKAMGL